VPRDGVGYDTRGTYYFKVQFAGTAQFLGTTSRIVKAVWK
jgi:hypothetical protein